MPFRPSPQPGRDAAHAGDRRPGRPARVAAPQQPGARGGHETAGHPLGLAADHAATPPVADHGAEGRVVLQPAQQAWRAARRGPGREQDERRGGQHGQEGAHDAQNQEEQGQAQVDGARQGRKRSGQRAGAGRRVGGHGSPLCRVRAPGLCSRPGEPIDTP